MADNHNQELLAVIEKAVDYAIARVGIDGLKRTSMFMSNNKRCAELKRAA